MTLRVRGLSGPGLSVLHLSDMHLGGRHGSTPPPWLEMLDGLRPDIVACTGDYTYSYRSDWGPALDVMAHLARRFDGSCLVGVRGNSDHPEMMTALARTTGLQVQNNSGFLYRSGKTRLWIGGVDDPHHELDDVAGALGGCPEDCPSMLLAHSPDVLLDPAVGAANIVLAGHTHGGQIRLPLVGALVTKTRVGRRFSSGLVSLAGTTVYVSRGLGGPPWRLLCPPEMTLISLVERAR